MVRPDFRDFSIHDEGIMHYGIKRRSGRYPWGSGDRPYQSVKDALKGKNRSEYFTEDRTIPKGTKMFRTDTTNEGISSKKSAYVTYLETDRDLYKGGYIRNKNKGGRVYEYQMELKGDVKVASRENFKTAVDEVIKKNPNLLKESVQSYLDIMIPENTYNRWMIANDPNTGEISEQKWDKFVKDAYEMRKNMSIDEQWGAIAVSLGTSDKLKDKIIDNLSKKGYNAIVDEAGVGGGERKIEGIDPLIIFDKDILDIKRVLEISKKEEQKSKDRYNKWANKVNTNKRW